MEKDKEFIFLQQMIHHINNYKPVYDMVHANIWLTRGDHFFFYCNKLLSSGELSNKY